MDAEQPNTGWRSGGQVENLFVASSCENYLNSCDVTRTPLELDLVGYTYRR